MAFASGAGADGASAEDHLFVTAVLSEGRLVREEALMCITFIRRMTILSTTFLGVALPLIVSVLGMPVSQQGASEAFAEQIALPAPFLDSVATLSWVPVFPSGNSVVATIFLIGLSFINLVFLRVYLGVFRQIYGFAKFYKNVVETKVNARIGSGGAKALEWESWVSGSRQVSQNMVGDNDLAIEPTLLAAYALISAVGAVVVSLSSTGLFVFSVIYAAIVLLVVLSTRGAIFRTLRDNANQTPAEAGSG